MPIRRVCSDFKRLSTTIHAGSTPAIPMIENLAGEGKSTKPTG